MSSNGQASQLPASSCSGRVENHRPTPGLTLSDTRTSVTGHARAGTSSRAISNHREEDSCPILTPPPLCPGAQARPGQPGDGVLLRRLTVDFAPTPGLRLPFGYHGHHEHDRVPVGSVEHWFQACKATSREQFGLMFACGTAAGRQACRP